jgi:hypothetical protein
MQRGMVVAAWTVIAGMWVGCRGEEDDREAGAPFVPRVSVTAEAGYRVEVGASGVSVSRAGERLLELAPSTARGLSSRSTGARRVDDRVVIEHGWAREELRVADEGVEQTWTLGERPPVPALDLRVPVRSADLVEATRKGLVLYTASGEYVTYGHATWIDGQGQRTSLAVRWDDGAIAITVPEQLLDASVFPAVLDPVIGVEEGLEPSNLVATVGHQDYPAIAIGTRSRLVVWSDNRDGVSPLVYGTVHDSIGTLAERAGFRLGRGRLSGTDLHPAVAFGASTYLVAWTSFDAIYFVRVDEDGTVLDSEPRELHVGGDVESAAVAFRAGQFVLAWRDTDPGAGIRAKRVRTDGTIVDAEPYWLVHDAFEHRTFSLRRSRSGFWVVFDDNSSGDRDVRLVRLDGTGNLLDATPITIVERFADQAAPDVAFDSTGAALVVWKDDATLAVHGASVTGDAGALTVGTQTRISVGSGERDPRAVFNGTAFQVAWISSQPGDPTTQVALVPTTGPARVDGVSVGRSWAQSVDIAFGGGATEVVWGEDNDDTQSRDVYRHRDPFGINRWMGAPTLVSHAAHTQINLRSASNDSRFFVAWVTPTPYGSMIYGARVNPLGEFEDTEPVEISSDVPAVQIVGVFSNGDEFLVAWHERTINPRTGRLSWHVMQARVSDAGDPSFPNEIRSFYDVFVYPVDVWVNHVVFPPAYTMDFVSGDVIYQCAILAVDCGVSRFVYEAPSVSGATALRSSEGAVYYRSSDGTMHRVTRTGAPMGGTPVAVPDFPSTAGDFDLSATRLQHVFVFDDGSRTAPSVSAFALDAGTGALRWRAETLEASGTPTPFARVEIVSGGYLAAWNRSGDLVGRRFTSDGRVIDPVAATISGESGAESIGDLTGDFLSRTLVAYSRNVVEPATDARRARVRVIDFRFDDGDPLGSPCETGFDCRSGQCADGVCCDSACGYSDPNDCQACSVAAGAASDGRCALKTEGSVCRGEAGECDVAELCDGVANTCPADAFVAADTACGAAPEGPCDAPDVCGGTSASCQARGLFPAGTVCRDARGLCDATDTCDGASVACVDRLHDTTQVCRMPADLCDAEERCDGVGDECPSDAISAAGTLCRRASHGCDVVERCDGLASACPPNGTVVDGTACEDGRLCNGAEVCRSGACMRGTTVDCDDSNPCTADQCTEADGCVSEPVENCCIDAADCDDGDPCTADSCPTEGGSCTHSPSVGCGDAGVDGGASGDAGVDGGTSDAGAVDPPSVEDGCGCSSGGSTTTVGLSLLVLAVCRWRRRVRRPPKDPRSSDLAAQRRSARRMAARRDGSARG